MFNISNIFSRKKDITIIRLLTFSVLTLALMLLPFKGHAIPTIRDAETEIVIHELARPIFEAANITPENVKIHLLQSNDLNAFVAGGMNIFIYTSLIKYSDSPETLMGVIAHETGHITGGHLIKINDQFGSLTATTALGYILGAASAIAGAPAVGQAIAAGTQHSAERMFLKFSRTQEQSADQAGLSFLQKLGYSPEGLLDLLNTLRIQAKQKYGDLDPYAITHPLSAERIEHIRHFMETNPPTRQIPNDLKLRYKRVVAKVSAFLESPSFTFQKFPLSDESDIARYARSVAYYRLPDIELALGEINHLIKRHPKDPFYHEMKGQILFENGRLVEAIESYHKAEQLLPDNALLKTQLAAAIIALEDDSYLNEAVNLLRQSTHLERENGFTWHQLGVAYGRQGKLGLSYLALTEQALITGKMSDAKEYAAYAKQYLEEGSPGMQRLIDLQRQIEKDT